MKSIRRGEDGLVRDNIDSGEEDNVSSGTGELPMFLFKYMYKCHRMVMLLFI